MADKNKAKQGARERRRKQIHKKIRGTAERPRLVVFRSNRAIYGQIVDDIRQVTLVSASTISAEIEKDVTKAKSKIERSKLAGKYLSQVAKEKNIDQIVFDRAGYLYHGRVKAFAEGVREGGLIF
jgi:large subunit ribosomal protein L18